VSRAGWLSVATLAVVVVGLLLGAEFALRYREGVRARRAARAVEHAGLFDLMHRASEDAELIYELIPGAEGVCQGNHVKINSSGFRDDEFPAVPPAGARRIVILGDSVAWGWGVTAEDAFPQVLERLLVERAPEHEHAPLVYNLAVDGYSTQQELRLLEIRALGLEPDVVVISYVLNDPDVSDGGLARHFGGVRRSELLYQVRKAAWLIRRPRALRTGPDPAWDYHHFVHHDRRELVRHQFERLGELARRERLTLVVAVIPVFKWDPSGGSYAGADLHASIERLCQGNGIQFIDLYEELSARDPADIAFDVWHPNEAGHEAIAEILSRTLAGLLWAAS
jgi:lysophospholipase L1-like esterase